MFSIVSQLRLCGDTVTEEDMLEKIFTTFHASNMLLQQQYRERKFEKYSQLISCLLVTKQNNELLMKNHNSNPTGSQPFPEANVSNHNRGRIRGRNRGRGRGRGRGKDRGRGYNHTSNKNVAPYHLKWNNNEKPQEDEKAAKKWCTY